MTFNDFRDKIKGMILEHEYFSDCDFEYKEVIKNNGTKMQGILIKYSNGLAPIIYINDFYDKYVSGVPMEAIKAHLYEMLDSLANDTERENEYVSLIKDLANFDFCKKIIYEKLINADMNKHIIEPGSNIPYIMHEGLGLISVFQITLESLNGGINNIMINNDMLNKWNMTKEELEKIAEENLEKNCPIYIDLITEVLSNLMKERLGTMTPKEIQKIVDEIENNSPNIPMYVVTNSTLYNGAQTMMYPDFISKVQQATGFDEFIIIPSSIHELIVTPYDANEESINSLVDMVASVNKEKLSYDEILSNNVFYCDGTKISIAGKGGS